MKGKLYCMVARLYEQEQRRLNSEKEEYRSLKSMGSLVIRQKRGNIFFSEKRGRQETGITHDSKRVLLLARKRVLRKSIAQREQVCRACKEFLRQIRAIEGPAYSIPATISATISAPIPAPIPAAIPELASATILSAIPETAPSAIRAGDPTARESLKLAEFSAEIRNWLKTGVPTNPYAPEELKYLSRAGIKLRSKSEMIIADKLTECGIAFKYEALFTSRNFTAYPDFTIRRWDGQLVLWEHFGLMNDEAYAEKALRKIRTYQSLGFSLHKNFIVTFEKDVEDRKLLERIIENYLL